ncbi:MAG: YihY/virulence factor BrkB family protein [Pseudomonadota bacterium]|nr:YihY/virulence factor BrkB family protein [Pseudomonadota bacterium]
MQPNISPESPEARRKQAAKEQARVGRIGPRKGSYTYEVLKRVFVGVYNDGFIHAGNLAYLALLSLFPFVIVAAAVARLLGQTEEGMSAVYGILQTMPENVRDVLRRPIEDVLNARSGNLLWLGAIVGLWTTGSFIETVRDIIRRAYGVTFSRPFWEYRLGSMGMIVASVVVAMIAFSISILLSSAQQFIVANIPAFRDVVGLFTVLRIVPGLVLFGALYLLFYALTPARYRISGCPKWPGAAFVAGWWLVTAALLPVVLSSLGSYDLTYGSLAGIVISLFFFFIIGLGLVIGAELNAALAETPAPTPTEVSAAVHEAVAEKVSERAEEEAVARVSEEARAERQREE